MARPDCRYRYRGHRVRDDRVCGVPRRVKPHPDYHPWSYSPARRVWHGNGLLLGKGLRTGSKASLACAFLVPFLLHGLYDFSLSEEITALNDNLVILPFVMIFVTLAMGLWIILKIRKIRREQDEEYLTPLLK